MKLFQIKLIAHENLGKEKKEEREGDVHTRMPPS